MRRAKIVCTLGPASSSPEVLEKMMLAGMNVARLNFSHGDYDYHRATHKLIREIARDLKRPVAILQDLQGPKIRVGKFKDGPIQLIEGSEFIVTADDIEGDHERVSTTYKDLPRDVRRGDILLLDDGLLRLRVLEVRGPDVLTEVEIGGTLKNNKGINLPTAAVSAPSLTEKDKEDLLFGLDLGIDYVALSFVRSALDLHQMRARLPKTDTPIRIISKIEKPQAIEDLDNIIAVSDGIMIARGDLGVELPPEKVPLLQKIAIQKSRAAGKLTITATQMLESMTENARPTRAEASDVANAILDGTDAVMLSAETASGKYPIRAIEMMAAIIEEVEQSDAFHVPPPLHVLAHMKTFPNAVARAAATAAEELNIHGIVALTRSGDTAKLLMTYRPKKPIIACTPSLQVYNQMAAFWGVEPYQLEMLDSTAEVLARLERLMREERGARTGDEFIALTGYPIAEKSETNLIKFHRIS